MRIIFEIMLCMCIMWEFFCILTPDGINSYKVLSMKNNNPIIKQYIGNQKCIITYDTYKWIDLIYSVFVISMLFNDSTRMTSIFISCLSFLYFNSIRHLLNDFFNKKINKRQFVIIARFIGTLDSCICITLMLCILWS